VGIPRPFARQPIRCRRAAAHMLDSDLAVTSRRINEKRSAAAKQQERVRTKSDTVFRALLLSLPVIIGFDGGISQPGGKAYRVSSLGVAGRAFSLLIPLTQTPLHGSPNRRALRPLRTPATPSPKPRTQSHGPRTQNNDPWRPSSDHRRKSSRRPCRSECLLRPVHVRCDSWQLCGAVSG